MSKRSSNQITTDDLWLRERRDELLTAIAQPVVRHVIGHKLARFRSRRIVGKLTPTAEDIAQDVLEELTRKLNNSSSDSPLWDAEAFKKYAARAAEYRCYDLFRDDLPGRERLRLKLRRILTTHPSFAIWQYEDRSVCGYVSWRDRDADPKASARLEGDAIERSTSTVFDVGLIATLLNEAGGPLEFERLIDIIFECCGLNKSCDISLSHGHSLLSSLIAKEHADDGLESKDLLRSFWKAAGTLPRQQRLAVVLHVADVAGDAWLQHILVYNIATLDEVSRVLGMNRRQLEELVLKLPLDFAEIAVLLGTSRTNARKLRHRGWNSIEGRVTP
jgi:RNA polymerase sigma factor (sigma-70 family)